MNRIDPNITFLYNLRALLKLSKPRVRLSIVVPDPDTTTCSNGSSLNFPVKSPYGSPRSVKLLIPPTCLAGEARCEAPRLS